MSFAYASSGPSSGASSVSYTSDAAPPSNENNIFSLDGVERVEDLRIEPEFLFKILLVGDSGVGKSSLVRRFADGDYSPTFISTIGVDFKIATLRIDGRVVKLQLWDTAGQERFRAITSSYYRGAHGVAMVYDVTDSSTLDSVKSVWTEEARRYGRKDAGFLLIGNKADMAPTSAWGEEDAAAELAAAHSMAHVRTSAKADSNVDAAFVGLVRRLMTERMMEEARRVKTNKNYVHTGKAAHVGGRSGMFDCCRVS